MGPPSPIWSALRMDGAEIDWRDDAQYAALIQADRSIFAWEWLRRDPAYAMAARSLRDGPARAITHLEPGWWSLHRFEDPSYRAPNARPIWTEAAHPPVLSVSATRAHPGPEAFDCRAFPGLVSRAAPTEGLEHLLISDGLKTIRLDVIEGMIGEGAAELRYLIAGVRSAAAPLLTLRRLLAFCSTGRLAGPLFRNEPRARRWILELRVHDALRDGACQREIAAELFGAQLRSVRWRVEAPTIRLQIQRLSRRARMMVDGGYRALLDGRA